MSDKDLLHGLYQAVNLYYNYTGKTPCLNLSSEATQELGTMGWDYQVGIRHVSCVPNVASFSGLSILHCLFGIL